MSKLLTVNDMADRLQLTVNVIYKLKKAGKLPPSLKIGGGQGVIRWREETVIEWEKDLEEK